MCFGFRPARSPATPFTISGPPQAESCCGCYCAVNDKVDVGFSVVTAEPKTHRIVRPAFTIS